MPAKRIKSLYKEKGHRMHRSHRSKRGSRKPIPQHARVIVYKEKLAKLKEQESYEDTYNRSPRIRRISDK